jgi:hypothetical protein
METTCLDDDVAEAAPLFENRDWRLHVDGLEHRETGYFIDRDTLNARRPDGHWEWPLHLSEKSWCGVRSFREAFTAALDTFGIAPDRKLTLSFALGFGTRVGGAAPDAFVPLADLVRFRAPAPRSRVAVRPLVAASA